MTMFIKSIQDRTNCLVGCIEYESYEAENITQTQFEKIVNGIDVWMAYGAFQ